MELRDEAGAVLASATSATERQVDETFDDLVSVRDAVIEGFALPADGVYTLYARPEEIATETTLSEAFSQSQLAFEALLLGPIERVNRWGVWIQDAITLILLGMSFAIVFRAQQFSLGAEGQLYFGALVSGIIALNSPNVPGIILIPFIILASGTAGFIYGLIPGALKAYLGANELVSTLMLNVVATRFFEMVLNFQLKPPDAGYVASAKFTENAVLPVIVDKTQVTVAVFPAGHRHIRLLALDPPHAPRLRDPHHRLEFALRRLWRRQFQARDHAGHGHWRHRGWLGRHAPGEWHPPTIDPQHLVRAGF